MKLVVHDIGDKLVWGLGRCPVLRLRHQAKAEQSNYERCARVHDAYCLREELDDPAHSIPWLAQYNATGLLNAAEKVQFRDDSLTFLVPVSFRESQRLHYERLIFPPWGCYT